jgi:hypothetical protein
MVSDAFPQNVVIGLHIGCFMPYFKDEFTWFRLKKNLLSFRRLKVYESILLPLNFSWVENWEEEFRYKALLVISVDPFGSKFCGSLKLFKLLYMLSIVF